MGQDSRTPGERAGASVVGASYWYRCAATKGSRQSSCISSPFSRSIYVPDPLPCLWDFPKILVRLALKPRKMPMYFEHFGGAWANGRRHAWEILHRYTVDRVEPAVALAAATQAVRRTENLGDLLLGHSGLHQGCQ